MGKFSTLSQIKFWSDSSETLDRPIMSKSSGLHRVRLTILMTRCVISCDHRVRRCNQWFRKFGIMTDNRTQNLFFNAISNKKHFWHSDLLWDWIFLVAVCIKSRRERGTRVSTPQKISKSKSKKKKERLHSFDVYLCHNYHNSICGLFLSCHTNTSFC